MKNGRSLTLASCICMLFMSIIGIFFTLASWSEPQLVYANGYTPAFTPQGVPASTASILVPYPTPVSSFGELTGYNTITTINSFPYSLSYSSLRHPGTLLHLGQDKVTSHIRAIAIYDPYNQCKMNVKTICSAGYNNQNSNNLCYESPIGLISRNWNALQWMYFPSKHKSQRSYSHGPVKAQGFAVFPTAIPFAGQPQPIQLAPNADTFNGNNIYGGYTYVCANTAIIINSGTPQSPSRDEDE